MRELLERFGLGERTKDHLEKLSLGNQQRVQIIAAVLPRPVALVLDEPFSGLDPVAVDSMVDLLRDHTRDGIPVLFSSHQLDLVERLCDRLVVLAQGRRVAAGTVAELRDTGVPRFRLVLGADAGWVRDQAGLQVLDLDGRTALLEVREPGSEQHLIAEATRRGDVHEFVRVRPALSEIYPGGDRMSTNREPAWLLVTRREVVSRITDKTFLLGTALMVAMLVGFIGFTAWQDEKTDSVTLAATPDSVAMATAVADAAPQVDDKVDVTVVEVDDEAAATAALTEDEADAWLHPTDEGWELTSESSEQDSLTAVVEAVVRQQVLADNAAAAGTTVEELEAGSDRHDRVPARGRREGCRGESPWASPSSSSSISPRSSSACSWPPR